MKTLLQSTVKPLTAQGFTYESSSMGYMIYFNSKPLGGVRSGGTATRTSWHTRRSWQALAADRKMHAETARSLCDQLAAGFGPAYLRKNIAA